jgi:DNA-binding NtrC family response regulator
MSSSKRILIVEDEMMIALHMEDTLAALGHKVTTATTSQEAEQVLEDGRLDLAIVDYRLTHGNTEGLMERLQAARVPFIVCSGMNASNCRDEM